MAFIYDEPSRTFGEYLLVPNLTTKDCVPANVDLTAPVVRFKADPGDAGPIRGSRRSRSACRSPAR